MFSEWYQGSTRRQNQNAVLQSRWSDTFRRWRPVNWKGEQRTFLWNIVAFVAVFKLRDE